MEHTDYDLNSGVAWRLEKSSTSGDGVTVTEYRVLAQDTTATAPYFSNQMNFTNDGLHGSMAGKSIRFELDGNGIFPDHEWTAPLTGYRTTDFGVWDATLTASGTGSDVFTHGKRSYADLTVTTMPRGAPPEELPLGASPGLMKLVVRIPTTGWGSPAWPSERFTDPATGWVFSVGKVYLVGDVYEVTFTISRPSGSSAVIPHFTMTVPQVLVWTGDASVPVGPQGGVPTSGYAYSTRSGLVPPDFVDRADPGGRSHLSPGYTVAAPTS